MTCCTNCSLCTTVPVFLHFLVRSRDRGGDRRPDRRSSRERDGDRERIRSRRGRSTSPSQRDKPPADEPPVKKRKEELDPILTRTGGAYIPPAKLRMMQAQITDKSRSGINILILIRRLTETTLGVIGHVVDKDRVFLNTKRIFF